jgi:hypothetical protein
MCKGKTDLLKARLKGEKLLKGLGTFGGLLLGVRTRVQDRKLAPIISHMLFRIAIDFVVCSPGTM